MTIDHSKSESLPFSWGGFLKKGHRTVPEQIAGLVIYLLICFGCAILSGWAKGGLGAMYVACLAFSMWTLWRRYSLRLLKLEVSLFLAQFLFQFGFFIMQEKLLALVALLLLWCNTLVAALLFWKKERLSSALLLFPLIWIFYLAGVNMLICISNP